MFTNHQSPYNLITNTDRTKPQGASTPATDTASLLMQAQAAKVNTYHIQEATEKLMNVVLSVDFGL
jgi:hypothetical protein